LFAATAEPEGFDVSASVLPLLECTGAFSAPAVFCLSEDIFAPVACAADVASGVDVADVPDGAAEGAAEDDAEDAVAGAALGVTCGTVAGAITGCVACPATLVVSLECPHCIHAA